MQKYTPEQIKENQDISYEFLTKYPESSQRYKSFDMAVAHNLSLGETYTKILAGELSLE